MQRTTWRSSHRFFGLVLLLGVVLGGCATSGTNSTSERAERDWQGVHVYGEAHLPEAAYERIGEVSGVGCKQDVYSSSSTRAKAVSAMKQQAAQAGGNGVLGMSCRRGQTTDCLQARRCTGTAIRVLSVDAVPRVAKGQRSNQFGQRNARSGTGWLLAPGLVVTSHRLVKDRSAFSVSTPDTTVSAELIAHDAVHNLALLRPTQPSVLPPPLPLAVDSVATGGRVFTAGYPGIERVGIRVATGIVSAQSGALGDARVYRVAMSSPFDRGGAPLLNFRGEVTGVLVPAPVTQGINPSRSGPEPVSYAVKNKYLLQLRTRLKQTTELDDSLSGDLPLEQEASTLLPLLNTVRPSILRVTAR